MKFYSFLTCAAYLKIVQYPKSLLSPYLWVGTIGQQGHGPLFYSRTALCIIRGEFQYRYELTF